MQAVESYRDRGTEDFRSSFIAQLLKPWAQVFGCLLMDNGQAAPINSEQSYETGNPGVYCTTVWLLQGPQI